MSTSITLRGITALLRDAIKGDTTLNAFCVASLGGALTLQVGSNPGTPLGESQSPYCIIIPVSKILGDTSTYSWEFDISFGYKNTVFSAYQTVGVVEMKGQYLIEEFGDKIITAIETVHKNYSMTGLSTNISSYAFPLHIGLHNITLTAPNVLSGVIGL